MGLKAFIQKNKRFPSHTELHESVNATCNVNYSMGWMKVPSTHVPTNTSGVKGWKNIARDNDIREAAIIDGWLYTDYPYDLKGIRRDKAPVERPKPAKESLSELTTEELVKRLAELSAELTTRFNTGD